MAVAGIGSPLRGAINVRGINKESFSYMLRIIIPNSLNAAAIGIAMPLLPLWFDMISRVKSAIDSFNGKYIFVSHSDPIRAIASYYLGWTEDDSFGIDIKNASMTVIDSDKKKVLCLGAINLDPEIKKLFY